MNQKVSINLCHRVFLESMCANSNGVIWCNCTQELVRYNMALLMRSGRPFETTPWPAVLIALMIAVTEFPLVSSFFCILDSTNAFIQLLFPPPASCDALASLQRSTHSAGRVEVDEWLLARRVAPFPNGFAAALDLQARTHSAMALRHVSLCAMIGAVLLRRHRRTMRLVDPARTNAHVPSDRRRGIADETPPSSVRRRDPRTTVAQKRVEGWQGWRSRTSPPRPHVPSSQVAWKEQHVRVEQWNRQWEMKTREMPVHGLLKPQAGVRSVRPRWKPSTCVIDDMQISVQVLDLHAFFKRDP